MALVANVGFGSVLFLVFQVLRSSGFHVDAWAVGIFALGGVFSSYRGRRGYFRTVHTIGPSRASAIQNSSPVFAFAFAFAWVFLGQTLSATDVALIAAVTVGLYFAGRTSGVGGPVRGRGTDRLFPCSSDVPVREFLVPLGSAAAMPWATPSVVRRSERWGEPALGALIGALSGTLVYFGVHISPV